MNISSDEREVYPFSLMSLPYKRDAFDNDFLSSESFDYHYDKHHANYVNTLNTLIQEHPKYHNKSLENIIITLSFQKLNELETKILNNAAQVWNHNFFWNCLSEKKLDKTFYKIFDVITYFFGSWKNFTDQFIQASTSHFASGWSWLCINKSTSDLKIILTTNAQTPIQDKYNTPLFCCDLWEHAYYIDFRNDRKKYVMHFLEHINWFFLNNNYLKQLVS